jgi:hypothetical protein
MARGDRGDAVFETDDDRSAFRSRGLEGSGKSDPRKVKLAVLLRAHTTVPNEWIAGKLALGHPGRVNRLVALCGHDRGCAGEVKRLNFMLIREDWYHGDEKNVAEGVQRELL